MTKRLSGAIALLTALTAIGGLIGFLAGGPSPPEAIAAAEGAAPAPAAPQTNAAWTAPDQEAAKKRAQELVPFVEAVMDECQLCRQMRLRETRSGDQRHHSQLFSPRKPDHQKDRGPLRPGALQTQQARGPAQGLRLVPSSPAPGCQGQGDHALLGLPPGGLPSRTSPSASV